MRLPRTLVVFQYGDAYAQGHVVFTVGITMPGAAVLDFLDAADSSWRLETPRMHARAF
jgi:hypothetical protein